MIVMPDGLKMTVSVETYGHPYSSKLILSVNEIVMAAMNDCFNTTKSFQATVLLSLSVSLSLSHTHTHTHTHTLTHIFESFYCLKLIVDSI